MSFNDDQLLNGILHELDHARHAHEALELATRNLRQDPHYYDRFDRLQYEPVRHAMPGEAVQYAQARAPKPDGITIAGQHYKPGQFIPGHALEAATPMQRRQIETGQGAKDPQRPRNATEKPLPHDFAAKWPWRTNAQDLQARLHQQGILRHAAIRQEGKRIVVDVGQDRKIGIRIADPGELERLWKQFASSAAVSSAAGGIEHATASVAGVYRNGEIILAPDFTDAELNHELVHGLRDLGILTDQEVARFGGEEQFAYGYQRWIEQGRPGHGVFGRVSNFFSALLGSRTAAQRKLFNRMDSGALLADAERSSVGRGLFAAMAAAVGANFLWSAMRPRELPLGRASVLPRVPETGIRADGSINTASILFATRDWESWWANWKKRVDSDPALQKLWSRQSLDSLYHGLAMTARIFGGFQLPEELDDVSPIRRNKDPLFEKTFDVSTICPQQDLYVDAINELQHRQNRVFTKHERFLIGQMLAQAGVIPTCWYCYGQSSRNNGAQVVLNGRDIWRQVTSAHQGGTYQRLLKQKPKEFKKLFKPGSETTNPWSSTGEFSAYCEKYFNHPEAHDLWENKLPRLHDLAMGYDEPKTEVEAATKRALNASMITVNLPKGWASYNEHIWNMDDEKLRSFNKSAGFRINSQTDFRPWHAMEVAQFLTHLGTKGGMAHVYTRKPEFVELFGDTGIRFNLSCSYATGADGRMLRDRDGSPMWDMSSFGQDGFYDHGQWVSGPGVGKRHALDLRQRNPNVGTMLVPTSVEQLLAGMDDPNIDMIIPYHAGAVPRTVDRHQKAFDFSDWQHEHWHKTGVTKKVGRQTVHQYRLKDGRLFWGGDKANVNVNGRNVTVTVAGPITREHHEDDKRKYLDLCDTLDITPRFPQLCGRWTVPIPQVQRTARGKLRKKQQSPPNTFERVNIDHPQYMKLVRDVARVDSPQKAVDAKRINWDGMDQHLEAYMKRRQGYQQLGKNKDFIDLLDTRIRNEDWPQPVGSTINPVQISVAKKSQHEDPQATVARYRQVVGEFFAQHTRSHGVIATP